MQPEASDFQLYGLFRRAIVEHSDEAWSEIYTRYRPMIVGWARQLSHNAMFSESPEDIADHAFARAWFAITPTQFEQFECVAAVLAYLRHCVFTAVVDESRAVGVRERICQHLELEYVATSEEVVVNEFLYDELWQAIDVPSLNIRERIVLIETFVVGLPPRSIYQHHSDLFSSIEQVYTIKRNLLNRLERCPSLRRLYQQIVC